MSVKIYDIIKQTAGGFHSWVRSDVGIIRKPNSELDIPAKVVDNLLDNEKQMEIIPIHYKLSKPVKSYKEIKDDADKLVRFIVKGAFKGFYNKAFALSHCQVSETPYAFFVVSPEVVAEKMFKSQVIINPQIIETPAERIIRVVNKEKAITREAKVSNIIYYNEPCMSFPFRKPKQVARFDSIKIKYQVPGFFGLKTIEEVALGIKSQIFQHETDHLNAKNIYFESENPVKWWDLIGKPKPVGGVSLDQFDTKDLVKTKEKTRDNLAP